MTSQRPSVFVLPCAGFFQFQGCRESKQSKINPLGPTDICTAEVNHSSNAYVYVQFNHTKPHFKYLHSVYIFKYRKGNTSVGLRSRGLMRFQKASVITVPRNLKKINLVMDTRLYV